MRDVKKPPRAVIGALIGAVIGLTGCTAESAPEDEGAADGETAPGAEATDGEVSVAPSEEGDVTAALEGLRTTGELRVCISDGSYGEMYHQEAGEMQGFDPDAVRALGDLWGVEVRFELADFSGLIPALDSGRCELVWSALYLSEERLEVADGVPYMETGPVLIIPQGNPAGIQSKADLSGKTIAVQSGGANIGILEEMSDELAAQGGGPIDIAAYPELPETVAAVESARADGLIETDVAAPSIIERTGGTLDIVEGVFEAETEFAAYVQKDSALFAALRQAIRELVSNGTFETLAEEHGLNPEKLVSP